jgi:ribonuclease HI
MGAFFRYHVGNVVVGLTQRQQATMSTVKGKARALLHAMKEAIHRGWDMVQFEIDSHVLTKTIRTWIMASQNLV